MDTLFLGGGMPVETLSTQALFTEYLYISSQLQAIISFRPGSSILAKFALFIAIVHTLLKYQHCLLEDAH